MLTLVALGSERAVELGLPLLENAATQEDAVFYANVLVEARTGWDADSRARFLGVVDALPDRFTGGNSFRGFLLAIANDAHARLGDGTHTPVVAAAASAPARPFVHDWQVDELLDAEAELAAGRDFERGRALFREATCFSCHRMRGEGGGTGPDLTGAGSRFTLRDLLEAVLEPSAVVSDLYAETEVLTTDDELIVGRSVSDRGGLVRVLKLPPDERVVEIPRDEVLELRPHAFSRMPEGLVDGLEREELLDLLAFLRVDGDLLSFHIDASLLACDASIDELTLPDGTAVALVVRGRELIAPRGSTVLRAGDQVFVICAEGRTGAVSLLFGRPFRA